MRPPTRRLDRRCSTPKPRGTPPRTPQPCLPRSASAPCGGGRLRVSPPGPAGRCTALDEPEPLLHPPREQTRPLVHDRRGGAAEPWPRDLLRRQRRERERGVRAPSPSPSRLTGTSTSRFRMDGPAGLPCRASRNARRAPTTAPPHVLGGLPEGPEGGMGVCVARPTERFWWESWPITQQECRRHRAFLYAKKGLKLRREPPPPPFLAPSGPRRPLRVRGSAAPGAA